MPVWSNRAELCHQAVTLDGQGMSLRAIARSLRVSRNTIRKILEAHARLRIEKPSAIVAPPTRAPRSSQLDPFRLPIADLFERYPGITAQRVLEEIRALGYSGGYTMVKDLVRKVRPAPTPTPSLVTPVYGPGEMAESDWSPYSIDFGNGQRKTIQVFSYVLTHSRRKSYSAHERSDHYALTDGHVHAFTRFQGVALHCKYDCQKAVVLGWEGQQPIYNPRFLAFTTYYEYRPIACRPRHPNDKPKVERSFWEFERSFLNGRSFHDLADFRAQLLIWLSDTADLRPHKKLKRKAIDMFAEEQPHLTPLPRHPYDTARVVYRVASIDGFVAWDGNRYAVPYDHVTDLLPIRVTEHELFVYAADLRLVIRHELAPRSAGNDVCPPGIHPPAHRKGQDLDQLQTAFLQLDDEAALFFTALVSASPRSAAHHARHILALRERFATVDIVAALRHALAFGALDHRAVLRILDVKAQPRRLAEYVAAETEKKLERILGRSTTEPRDLYEYDHLPVASPTSPKEPSCPDQSPPTTTSSNDSDDTSSSSG